MSRAGAPLAKPAATTTGIPQSAKKVIQLVKEAVPGWDDDQIYSALKECSMDPNEAVQRLVTAEPYKEVKRKKEKKKEGGQGVRTQPAEVRPRAPGVAAGKGGRGGGTPDRGLGRGTVGARPPFPQAALPGVGAPRAPFTRENGFHPRPAGGMPGQFAPVGFTPPKPVASSQSGLPLSAAMAGAGMQLPFGPGSTLSPTAPSPISAATLAGAPGLSNGDQRPLYSRGPQGSWGSAHTLADIVKANGPPQQQQPAQQQSSQSAPPPQAPQTPPQFNSTSLPVTVSSPPSTSGVYAAATDPVLHPSLDARAPGGALKRELGSVQRPISKERPQPGVLGEPSGLSSVAMQGPSLSQGPSSPPGRGIGSPGSRSLEAPQVVPPLPKDTPVEQLETQEEEEDLTQQQPQQHHVQAAQRPGVAGQYAPSTGLEWKPKPAASGAVGGLASALGGQSASGPSSSGRLMSPPLSASAPVSSAASQLQDLSLQEEKPVILPGHLQLSEADRSRLSFGSFGAGFGSQFGSFGPGSDEAPSASSSKVDSAPATSPPKSSMGGASGASQGYSHAATSSALPSVSNSVQETSVPSSSSQPEQSKHEAAVQPGPQYPYHAMHTYHGGYGLVPAQVPNTQYGNYDPADTQGAHNDASRLPNLGGGMPYGDAASNYYSQAFRPGSDSKYSDLSSSASASSKYGSSSAQGAASQSLQHGQEGGSSSSGGSHSSQVSGVVQSMPTMLPQQMMHPFGHPAGMPPGAPYSMAYYHPAYGPSAYYQMQQAYNHPYGPTGASGYPQGPAGSTYPPTAGSAYPPGAAAPGKFPMGPPYGNPKSAAAGAPHSAAAGVYAGYAGAPSAYAQPSASTGSASGYEDIGGSQYKDSSLYIPAQQGQLSRDMGGSSYYNMPGQGQHGYGQGHHAAHPHAYAASMYGQSQPPTQASHQMLQQSQGAGSTPQGSGGYQQSQRGGQQQSWTPNY